MIEKRGSRTIVTCNGEKLLDITISSKTCDYEVDEWKNITRTNAEIIEFPREHDTGTKFYYAGKGFSSTVHTYLVLYDM